MLKNGIKAALCVLTLALLFIQGAFAMSNTPFKDGQHAYFRKHVSYGAICPSYALMSDFMKEKVSRENWLINQMDFPSNITGGQFLNTLPRLMAHNKIVQQKDTQYSRVDDCFLLNRHKRLHHIALIILGKPKAMQLRTYYNYKTSTMMKGPNSFWRVKLIGKKWTGIYWVQAKDITSIPLK